MVVPAPHERVRPRSVDVPQQDPHSGHSSVLSSRQGSDLARAVALALARGFTWVFTWGFGLASACRVVGFDDRGVDATAGRRALLRGVARAVTDLACMSDVSTKTVLAAVHRLRHRDGHAPLLRPAFIL